MADILAAACRLLVIGLGPLSIPLLPRLYDVSLRTYLERYLAFALVFLLWGAARMLLGRFSAAAVRSGIENTARLRIFRWAMLAAFLVCGAGTLLSLQYLRPRFGEYVFYLVLATMCLGGLADSFRRRKRNISALLLEWLAHTATGYLSILVIAANWYWPPLLIAAALGSLVTSVSVLEVLCSRAGAEPAADRRELERWARLHAGLVGGGASCMGVLAVWRIIPQHYLATLLVIPLAYQLLNRLRQDGPIPERGVLLRQGSGICILFVVIVLVLGII